jgi:prepilin-type N-terminal cleavage/methylation domain-containing protein
MNRNGFTLTEVIIVILLIMILLAIAIPQFGSMTRKYNIERETRQLYADMINARMRAMNTNRTHILTATATAYSIADDKNSNGVIDAGEIMNQSALSYPVTWGTGTTISFDSRGIPNATGTVYVTAAGDAAFDCIAVQVTKLYIGKMTGGACVQK